MFRPLKRSMVFIGLALALFLSSFVIAAPDLQPAPTPTPTQAAPVKVDAKIAGVRFRQNNSEEQLNTGDTRLAGRGDGVNVNDDGEAWLHFPQALLVRLFRDSQIIKLEGRADTAVGAIDRFFLEVGTIFGAPDPNDLAKLKMTVDTQWATITDTGTRFLVHYDLEHQVTWVVVDQGSVQVTAGGVPITVSAGWQTWVEFGGRQPQPPIPASRAVIGNRFPLVDALTNNALHDPEVLANQQCVVIGAGLNTREGPGPAFRIADVLKGDERFEAIRRTNNAGGPVWIYGITPRGVWGWVDAAFVRCDYQITQLSSDAVPPLFSGWETPPAMPTDTPLPATPIPTDTATPTPTDKPTKHTSTPTAVPPTTVPVPPTTVPVPPTTVPVPSVVPPPIPPAYAAKILLPPSLLGESPLATTSPNLRVVASVFGGMFMLLLMVGDSKNIIHKLRQRIVQALQRRKRPKIE